MQLSQMHPCLALPSSWFLTSVFPIPTWGFLLSYIRLHCWKVCTLISKNMQCNLGRAIGVSMYRHPEALLQSILEHWLHHHSSSSFAIPEQVISTFNSYWLPSFNMWPSINDSGNVANMEQEAPCIHAWENWCSTAAEWKSVEITFQCTSLWRNNQRVVTVESLGLPMLQVNPLSLVLVVLQWGQFVCHLVPVQWHIFWGGCAAADSLLLLFTRFNVVSKNSIDMRVQDGEFREMPQRVKMTEGFGGALRDYPLGCLYVYRLSRKAFIYGTHHKVVCLWIKANSRPSIAGWTDVESVSLLLFVFLAFCHCR